MSLASPDRPDAVFAYGSFRRFWSSRVLSTMAFQLQGVAVGWQIYALTHSTLALGLVGLVQYLPMLALTILIGHVVDRYDRRRIATACQLVAGSATALLAIGSFAGWLTPPVIFAAVAVIGASRAFEMPTMQSLLPGLVPQSLFPGAAAYSASAIQTATIVGPALGGFIYVVGPEAPYACAALLSLAASVLSWSIRMERPAPRGALHPDRPRENAGRETEQGGTGIRGFRPHDIDEATERRSDNGRCLDRRGGIGRRAGEKTLRHEPRQQRLHGRHLKGAAGADDSHGGEDHRWCQPAREAADGEQGRRRAGDQLTGGGNPPSVIAVDHMADQNCQCQHRQILHEPDKAQGQRTVSQRINLPAYGDTLELERHGGQHARRPEAPE